MFRSIQVLLYAVPSLFYVAGLVVALVLVLARRGRIGSSATTLAASGIGLLIFADVASFVWTLVFPRLMVGSRSIDQIQLAFGVQNIVIRVFHLVAIGLIIAAVFARRPDRPEAQPIAPRT